MITGEVVTDTLVGSPSGGVVSTGVSWVVFVTRAPAGLRGVSQYRGVLGGVCDQGSGRLEGGVVSTGVWGGGFVSRAVGVGVGGGR